MGLLREPQNNGQIPYYTGLQIQTSGNNVPIAIVWGANKIAPNCIWTGGFYGYYGYPEGSHGAGGKGGGGNNGGQVVNQYGQSVSQSWQYYTSWEMALCEGPINGIGTIWMGNNPTNIYGAGIWAVFYGTQSQPPWSLTLFRGAWRGAFLSWRCLYHVLQLLSRIGRESSAIRDGNPRGSVQLGGDQWRRRRSSANHPGFPDELAIWRWLPVREHRCLDTPFIGFLEVIAHIRDIAAPHISPLARR